jgi:hypothetical protein
MAWISNQQPLLPAAVSLTAQSFAVSLNLRFTRFGESEILINNISEAIEAIHDS